jgi:protein-tyrosine phosphatase
MTRLLFVCLGNICRSPAAEAAFLDVARAAGRLDEFEVDSAGTGHWHVGERADERMRHAADQRGIAITSRARQVSPSDFEQFDYILAMDRENLRVLAERAPRGLEDKLRLFRDFDPEAPGTDVPDPYYGGADGFEEVLDIVSRTAAALLEQIPPGSNELGPRSTRSARATDHAGSRALPAPSAGARDDE